MVVEHRAMALQGVCGLKPPSPTWVMVERSSVRSSAESTSLPARLGCCCTLVCRAVGRPKGTPPGKDRVASGPASVKKQGFSAGNRKPKRMTDEENEAAEAALEALFQQLEKDLEEDGEDGEDEELTPEELEELERELGAALADIEDLDEELGLVDGNYEDDKKKPRNRKKKPEKVVSSEAAPVVQLGLDKDAEEESKGADENAEQGEDDEVAELLEEAQEPRIVNLERWQLKKLAAASELRRRHVNIKALAAETGLDRSDVLAWLKNPIPELIAELAMEPDVEDTMEQNIKERGAFGSAPSTSGMYKGSLVSTQGRKGDKSKAEPVAQSTPRDWHNQKRLSKVEVATFERVYQRSRHPTNAMLANMVHLTNVPRKRIIKWFDTRRAEVEKDSQTLEPVAEQ